MPSGVVQEGQPASVVLLEGLNLLDGNDVFDYKGGRPKQIQCKPINHIFAQLRLRADSKTANSSSLHQIGHDC